MKKLKIQNFHSTKEEVKVYSTYEPCLKCRGYLQYLGVDRVIWDLSKSFDIRRDNYLYPIFQYWFSSRGGIDHTKSSELMRRYKESSRELRREKKLRYRKRSRPGFNNLEESKN